LLSILNVVEEADMWTNAYSYEDIGQFLREARRARGITQAQMAKKLGFSTVTLSALETGKNVSSAKVERYLQMLGYRMVIVPKSASVEVNE
jgi:transcriptional regulator with XRE-family HTH domain